MRLIKVENISPEQKLAKPIYHEENILLNNGVENLHRYKNRLQELGVRHVYVEDEISQDIEVNDVIKEETRSRGKKIIGDTFNEISFNNNLDIKKVKNFVDDVINQLFSQDQVVVNLIDLKSFHSYTFTHSVNVAVLSLILARSLNYSREDMRKLGVGAILHDIGKTMVPEDVIKKPGKLTNEEYEIAQKHAKLGYDYVRDNLEISPLSRTVILKHHERIDGTGYPGGNKGEELHEFSKIGAITDVFDALNSDRVYRSRWPVNKIINYLMTNPNKFDRRLVKQFIQRAFCASFKY